MKHYILGLAAATAAITTPLTQASDADAVIVTATRTAQTVDQSLASVTVINHEEIERSQAKSIEELLTGLAGIDASTKGGYGKVSSLFLRGTNSNHVLVLIDGMQVGSATLGTTSFEFLPLDQIERIEIVRGPRSSLYGAQAIGGVIQIFTRQGGKKYQTRLKLGAGSNNLKKASVNTSGSHGNSRYSYSLSSLKTDGFDARDDTEFDEDGYSNLSGSVQFRHDFDSGLSVDARIMQAQGDTEYDGSRQNSSDFVQRSSGVTLSYPFSENWFSALKTGTSLDNSKNFLNGTQASTFITKREFANWQNDITLGRLGLLTAGIDYQNDKVESTSAYPFTERDNTGLFVQHQGQIRRNDLAVSLRLDDNEVYGEQTTGSFAWGYSLPNNMRITASYGTAFKAPTFNDLSANLEIKPEESETAELGLEHTHDWGLIALNTYVTKINKLISWRPTDEGPWAPFNDDNAKIRGAELRASADIMGWNSRVEFSWQDPRNQDTGEPLFNRTQRSARIDMDRQFGKFTTGLTLIAQGTRQDAAVTQPLAGYGIVNLRTSWAISKQWTLKGNIKNLGDKDYETVANYNTGGRLFYVGVSYDAL